MRYLKVYTDGAYSMKNRRGGWSFVVTENDKIIYYDFEHVKDSTNNRMEIMGVIEGIIYCKKNFTYDQLTIISDSQYVINGANVWVKSWARKDFLDVKNDDLWRIMYNIRTDVIFRWVRGHNGNKYNEEADRLAVLGRELSVRTSEVKENEEAALNNFNLNDDFDRILAQN